MSITSVSAQGDYLKVSKDIRQITAYYYNDFKGMRGRLKSEDGENKVYFSKYKLAGSVDSSNLLYQDKLTKLWTFHALMKKESVTADDLESIASQVILPFGKLTGMASGVEWITMFVPEKKKGGNDRIKRFHLSIYDGMLNPNDKTGGALILKLGGAELYNSN
jgi:hypothetical protein